MHILYHHRTAGDRVERVHIMGIVRALRRRGHTVEISSPPGCSPERENSSDRAPGKGRVRHCLKVLARKAPAVLFEVLELGYNLYSLADMLRRMRHRKPDMIYERTTSNSVVPTYLARRWSIPIVQEVNVTTEIGRLRPLILSDLTKRLERWMIRNSHAFVTVSEYFKRKIVADGFPEDQVSVCQNAIDSKLFNPNVVQPVELPAHFSSEVVIVGYVGAFVPWHRLDMMVHAARRIATSTRVGWLMVGDGADRPRVEELISRFGMGSSFWLPGRVSHETVPSYVMSMDVAVMPHSNTHGSPMKLFEYMAMRKAVVAPSVPAIEEVIEHERTGLLFEAGNQESFQQAVQRLVERKELRERLGRNAREQVLKQHTWEANARHVLQVAMAGTARSQGALSDTDTLCRKG